MRARSRAFAALAMAAVALPIAATTASATRTAQTKAAWIYVGPHNDGGWSQAHDEGRLAVQKALGSTVKTTYKENVPEGSGVSQVIEQLVRDGNKIIFGTSFGYQDAMLAAAKKHPDVYFEQATGYKSAKNFATYFGAGEDAIYLSGMAAGAASKSGIIGYVVPFPIPEVIRHTNAFALGAQATHPGVKIKVIWTNSWFSPDKEKKAAENLASAGADVIGQNVDSPSAGKFAESKGLPWVGYDSDASAFAPKQWLTAAVYDWGPYYTKRVKAAIGKSWKTGSYYGNIKDGFTDIAKFGPGVSAKTKAAIAAKRKGLINGSFYEFAGPIVDQGGKVRVAKGKRASLGEILSMDWFVRTVVGSPKGS